MQTRSGLPLPHPECRPGEMFLMNVPTQPFEFMPNEFEEVPDTDSWLNIGWKTKRSGTNAYDTEGKPIDDAVPVFVRRSEIVAAGIDPDRFHLLHQ